jgi:hypothetical protein
MRRKTMTKYIANVNGDWWEHTPDSPLFILDTDDLTAGQFDAIMEDVGELEGDKFEDVIREYGKQVTLHV